MRLSDEVCQVIKAKTLEYFGTESGVYLFGSRTDPMQRGGDIDIYIETLPRENMLETKIHYLVALEKEIGEQKIDVVINDGLQKKPIFDSARRDGVKL